MFSHRVRNVATVLAFKQSNYNNSERVLCNTMGFVSFQQAFTGVYGQNDDGIGLRKQNSYEQCGIV